MIYSSEISYHFVIDLRHVQASSFLSSSSGQSKHFWTTSAVDWQI